MKVLKRYWLVAMAVGWSGVLAGGCDAETDDSVFDCDPDTQACGAEDSSEDEDQDQDQGQDSADEDDDDACVGEECDPGQPPEPEPEPDDDDPGGDDDGYGGMCDEQYDACVEGNVTPEACAVQREACETPRGDDDDPACSLVEFGDGGPGGDDEQEIWLRCYDNLDADCDGLVDCEDPDCDFVCNPGGDTSGDDEPGDHCYQTPDAACYGCTCVPGSVRDCHVPGPCTWGKSTCLDDGTWGQCQDTGDVPPACDLGGGSPYDVACCVEAGRCCENLDYDYSLYDDTQGAHASVGNCGEVCAGPPT